MSDLPKTMYLKPNWVKWFGVLLVSAGIGLVALFVIDAGDDPVMRWGAVAFGAVGVAASLPGLFGWGSYLSLEPDGFEFAVMGKKHRRSWAECSEFSLINMRGGPFVGFTSATDEGKAGAGLARSLVGETGMLPDRYGMKARDLAGLMNQFRARALEGCA